MRISRLASCAALLIFGACSTPSDPSVQRLALLSVSESEPEVSVPAQAFVGQPFTVVITTWSGGCIGEGDTDVRVNGQTAVITPFEKETSPEGGACIDVLLKSTREARVTFNAMGTGTIRVLGRAERGAGSEIVTVTRAVPVTAPGTR